MFPGFGFRKVIGYRNYILPNKLKGLTPFYLWATHMFKRFAGTYGYIFTKDMKFMQELLCHEKIETTSRHYVEGVAVARGNDIEKMKNKLFDYKFYESIKGENEDIPAVWDEIKS
ncbi:hypothetical protein HYT26_00760 [Candidatus Pacearchaeota archaeon]|nr:hypothetical protein [Candidatus Pacearchaeota archaeon]